MGTRDPEVRGGSGQPLGQDLPWPAAVCLGVLSWKGRPKGRPMGEKK